MKHILAVLLLIGSAFGQLAGMAGEKGVVQGIAPLTISTTSPMPTGTQSAAYNCTMSATGGVLPYIWAVTSGAMPTGVTLNSNGTCSGTASTAQTVTPTIQVTDAASHTNSDAPRVFSITIQAAGSGCSGYAANRTVTVGDPTQVPPSGSLLNVAGASYCLSNDISCPDSCFGVQADNISLDGTNHVATYATTNAAQQPRFGIVGIGCGETDATGNPCGGRWTSPTISNITFTQGANAVGVSDAMRFGGPSGAPCGGGTFTNITTNITQPGGTTNPGTKASRSMYFRYCQGTLTLSNVTTHNAEVWVQNRVSIEGPDIRTENWSGNSGAVTIANSNISGAGQGGIYPAESWNANIHDTTIGASGHVVQDFAAFVWGTNDNFYNLTIDCTSCRGAQIGGHNFHPPATDSAQLHDSTITTHMLLQYCPDNHPCPDTSVWGCENHGTYGVQFDDGPTNSTAYNNTVTVHAGACPATALRVTDIGAGNTSHNNSYISIRDNGAATGLSYSYGTEAIDVGAFSSTDDTWQADSINFFGDWQGQYAGATFLRPTIVKGSNPDPGYVTFSFKNGDSSNCNNPSTCAIHWTFIDPTFSGGASKDSHNMTTGSSGGGCAGCGPAEYFIERTYKPTILCAIGSGSCTPGNAVSGATVTINDVTPTQVFTGNTDASGHIASGAGFVLIEFRRANCTTFNVNGKTCSAGLGAVFKEMHTPHSIAITKAGCTTLNYTLDLTLTTNGSISENRNLTCP